MRSYDRRFGDTVAKARSEQAGWASPPDGYQDPDPGVLAERARSPKEGTEDEDRCRPTYCNTNKPASKGIQVALICSRRNFT